MYKFRVNALAPTRFRRGLHFKQSATRWTSAARRALGLTALLASLWCPTLSAAPWLHPSFNLEEQQTLRADTRALSLLDRWLDDSEIVLPDSQTHTGGHASEGAEPRTSQRGWTQSSQGSSPVCELRRGPVSFSEFVAARVHFVYPNRLVIPGLGPTPGPALGPAFGPSLEPSVEPNRGDETHAPLPLPGPSASGAPEGAQATASSGRGSSAQPPSGWIGNAPLRQLRARNESLLLIKQSLLASLPQQERLDPPSGLPFVLHPRVGWLRLGERYFNADDVELGIFESRGGVGQVQEDPAASSCSESRDTAPQLSADLLGGLIEVRSLSRVAKQLSRLATWVHEARHSDCSPGAFLSWTENPRILPGSRCGWVHSRCLAGSIYSGALACDATLGGAYGIQAEFFRRIHRACTRCSGVQRRAALIHLHEVLAHLGPGALNQWRARRRFKLSSEFELPEQIILTGARRQSLTSARDLSLEFFLRTH
jgi:hypothetical protein